MSKVAENKFAGLRSRQPATPPATPPVAPVTPQESASAAEGAGEGALPPPAPPAAVSGPSAKKGARAGKVTVAGYFSEDLSREFKMLALQSGVTVQALLGEAIDDLFRKHGKHPFGER